MSAMFYGTPSIFLPANSLIPWNTPAANVDHGALGSLLKATLAESGNVAQHLTQRVLAYHQLPGLLQPLMGLLEAIQQTVAEELASLDTHTADPAILAQLQADQPAHMIEHYRIYDDYFQVHRLAQMNSAQFVGQVVGCARNVLLDLPYTQMDCHQLANLIATLTLMFQELTEHFPASDDIAPEVPLSLSHHQVAASWESDVDDEKWAEQLAFFRWRLGHHFFNLCNIFARDLLCRVQAHPDDSQAAQHLCRAGECLLGTSFAMWYAGNFMPSIYESTVRPSMVMPNSNSGFSGDQNLDYNRFKQVKDDLLDQFRRAATPRSPALLAALASFQEADLLDKEQHLVLVAAKVGNAQSLSQEVWQAELPPEIPKLSAVDILREMLQAQREQLIR